MEQETLFMPQSPRQVRRQLCFVTPSKQLKLFDPRTEEIQKTPKCKLSKSKVIEKISKNKVIIDFDIAKNYFLDDIDTAEYFSTESRDPYESHLEQMLFGSNGSDWRFNTPLLTAKKPKFASANLHKFTSVAKESGRCINFDESPFCRLLNESDQFTADKYQTLSGNKDDESSEAFRQYANQAQVLEKFFYCFQQRSANIMELFVQDAVFEILGEDQIYNLNLTLNALAKAFVSFEHHCDSNGFSYNFAASDDESEIIVSAAGKLVSQAFQQDFTMSAKISLTENLIKYVKLQLC